MPSIQKLAVALTPREIANFLPGAMHDELLAAARHALAMDTSALSPPAFQKRLAEIDPDVLVACWKTPPLPDVLPGRLKYVCYLAGSVRRLVTRAHLENGLLVSNWGASISRVVAESALMLALAALRRAGRWMPAMQRDGAWEHAQGETASLFERRVGIHGFGRIARELVRLLGPFGVDIGICAPEADPGIYSAHGVRRVAGLDELFSDHDVIFELAPLIPSTIGIVTESLLRKIRPGGVFVNLGRGAVVDEAAMIRILGEGRILAALDVYATEPLPAESPLRRMTNVVLSPHLGGPTTDRCRDAGAFGLSNLRAYITNRPLESVVTPTLYDAAS